VDLKEIDSWDVDFIKLA